MQNNTIETATAVVIPLPIWGHFTAGMSFLAFGSTLVILSLLRLRRILLVCTSRQSTDLEESPTEKTCWTRKFLEQHTPERDPTVLRNLSLALMPTAIFGFLYQGFGVAIFDQILHPDYSFFHYAAHQSATLLALLAGWTGWLESSRVLPKDSFRAALVFGLLGEVLLWLDHAANKQDEVNARLHAFLALISLLTAVSMGWSMTATKSDSAAALVAYFGGYVGLMWQGVWFLVVSYHLKWPMASAEHVTVLFVLVATGFILVAQLVAVYMKLLMRRDRQRSGEEESYSPLRLGVSCE